MLWRVSSDRVTQCIILMASPCLMYGVTSFISEISGFSQRNNSARVDFSTSQVQTHDTQRLH